MFFQGAVSLRSGIVELSLQVQSPAQKTAQGLVHIEGGIETDTFKVEILAGI